MQGHHVTAKVNNFIEIPKSMQIMLDSVTTYQNRIFQNDIFDWPVIKCVNGALKAEKFISKDESS